MLAPLTAAAILFGPVPAHAPTTTLGLCTRFGHVHYIQAADMKTCEVRAYDSKAMIGLLPPASLPNPITKLVCDERGGVDELLEQCDPSPTRTPTFILQDAGLDVIAVCDLEGTPSTPFPNGTARIVGQFGYDAYGSVVTAETLFAHAPLHVGHKGLFFDRLDLGVVDPTTLEEMPRLAVGSTLIGNARNRILLTWLGRWGQRDPNATGAVLMAASPRLGEPLMVEVDGLALSSHYFDGPNIFEYVGSNPMVRGDESGTSMLAVNLFGSMGLLSDLRVRDATAKAAVGGLLRHNLAVWEQMAMGLIAGGTLLSSLELHDVLTELGLFATEASKEHTRELIFANTGPQTHAKHGDPRNWKPKGEKRGSGREGSTPGDVKYYQVYWDYYGTLIEAHFFRDAGGFVKQHTIKIIVP